MKTIKDIAKQSGYSVATVSRVLNNKKHVSEQARKEIRQTIKELNYVPNNIARNLNNGQTFTIGFVLPHTKHPFFTRVLNGAMAASFDSPYNITILPSNYNEEKEEEYLKNLCNKTYDGLIFSSHGLPIEKIAPYTHYAPIVCCEDTNNPFISAVYANKRPALLQAFDVLKQKQVKHIAILLSRHPSISPTSQQIVAAYNETFHTTIDDSYLLTDVFDYQDGYYCAERIIAEATPLDAIFSNLDDAAAGFRQCFIDHQMEIPFLIGQENQLSSRLINIPTIDYHLESIGYQAFQLIATNQPIKKIKVESEFIYR